MVGYLSGFVAKCELGRLTVGVSRRLVLTMILSKTRDLAALWRTHTRAEGGRPARSVSPLGWQARFSFNRNILIESAECLISILVMNYMNAQCFCTVNVIFLVVYKHGC